MKKSKLLLQFAVFTASLIMMVGCGKRIGTEGTSAFNANTSDRNTEQDLRMLVPDRLFPLGAGTQDGYYYVEPGIADSLTGQIRYVDYANAVDIPLSAQINSNHMDETDSACLDSIIGDYRMFVYNDHLYFIRSGSYSYVNDSTLGKLARGAVYRMDLDGGNQTLVYESDGSGNLQMYAVGGKDVLYLFQRTSEAVDVIRVPENGGNTHVIASLPLDANYQLIGCRKNWMYFHVMGYDPDKINSLGGLGSITHTLTVLNVQTGELNDLCDLCPDDSQYAEPYMAGTTLLYYYPNGGPQVAFCDEQGQVQSTVTLVNAKAESFQQIDNPYVVGDTLFIPCWDDRQKQGYQILVDCKTGNVSRSDICLTQEDGKDSLGAAVLAETETDYLAVTAIGYKDAEMPLADGTTTSVQNQVYMYSLIPKQQFTAQTPVLQTVHRQ
mgnify:CR=1 FL=1